MYIYVYIMCMCMCFRPPQKTPQAKYHRQSRTTEMPLSMAGSIAVCLVTMCAAALASLMTGDIMAVPRQPTQWNEGHTSMS